MNVGAGKCVWQNAAVANPITVTNRMKDRIVVYGFAVL